MSFFEVYETMYLLLPEGTIKPATHHSFLPNNFKALEL